LALKHTDKNNTVVRARQKERPCVGRGVIMHCAKCEYLQKAYVMALAIIAAQLVAILNELNLISLIVIISPAEHKSIMKRFLKIAADKLKEEGRGEKRISRKPFWFYRIARKYVLTVWLNAVVPE
jgi:hypothetical protein